MVPRKLDLDQKSLDSVQPRGRGLFDGIVQSIGDADAVPVEWKKFSTRFDATCRSAMKFLEGKGTQSEFRDWIELTPADDFWNEEPLPEDPVSIGPCQFETVGDLVVIGNAAVLVARDRADRHTLLRRLGRLFDQADWLESAQPHSDAENLDRIRENAEALIDRWSEGAEGIFPPGDPIDGPVGDPEGDPIRGPGRFGRPPLDNCALRRRLCMKDIIDLLEELGEYRDTAPISRITFADNITRVTRQACAGDVLEIEGVDFGDSQPSNIRLSMPSERGCDDVEVAPENWTDTRISFTVPDWARGGCVGFFDDDAISEWNAYWSGYEDRVDDINSIAIECRPFGSGMPVMAPRLPRLAPACPTCLEANRFLGTVPEIKGFQVNGRGEWRAQPDDSIRLSWVVENADTIEVSLSTPYGEPFSVSENMIGRSRIVRSETITMDINADGDAVYRLSASNSCGSVESEVIVHIRQNTLPALHGIEAVQVIQTFVSDNSSASNTVPIIEGKRTLARIYVSSGLPATYNVDGRLQNITARARVRGLSSGGTLGTFVNADTGYGGAPPNGSIARGTITDTLNVEVPFNEIQGRFEIEVEVFSTDPWSRWRRLTGTLEIEAYPSPTLDIVPIDVIDNFRATAGPTPAERTLGIADIRSGFPLGESNLRLFTTSNPVIITNRDYDVAGNWRNNSLAQDSLMDDLEEVAEEFEDNGEVWCATVPQAARSGIPGIIGTARSGTIFRYRKANWITFTPRTAANLATAQRTAPHEIGHVLGMNHGNGNIGEFGVEVRTRTVFPTTTTNLMNSAAGPWVNVAQYVYLLAFMRRDVRPRLIREGWSIARILDLLGAGL